jgi:uncharacterized protein GlcG (DUF336 family)
MLFVITILFINFEETIMNKKLVLALLTAEISLGAVQAQAACKDVSYAQLQSVADNALASASTGGLGLNMWATFVDETGKVCAVVNTGAKGALAGNSQWLGSRVISAQKANTGNAFSLDGLAISSGALFAAVQPGGSLYGLQESNPVNADDAYKGSPTRYGKINDPLVGNRVGGINVFGGGLPLYKNGVKIGGIGVSGDTSCTDHAFVWKMRSLLGAEPSATVAQVEKLKLTGTFVALGDHPACIGGAIADQSGFVASGP